MTFPQTNGTEFVPRHTGRRGVIFRSALQVFVGLLVALVLLDACGEAQAAGRRGRSRGSSRSRSRMMSLVKKQMTAQIQQQIEAAKKVLAAAESKASMTQAELGQEMAKLSQLQGEVGEARVRVAHAAKAVHAVEADLLENLPPTSALAQAESALEQKRREVHQAMHRILKLPDHPRGSADAADVNRQMLEDRADLSAAQRAALKDDPGYQALQEELRQAGAHVDQARRELFEKDADWAAAQKELTQAQQQLAAERRETKAAAAGSGRDKQQLYTAQSLAAQARAIIVQGEARLRQLNSMSTSRPRYGSRYPQRRR